ncbi:hypothetical protein MJI69_29690, partial [Salmonella enterica subsp. enterica serovar Anatum]|nr:hypothetical protein [Salmonella enterica subsp. enterica serovar Anatum]
TDVKAGIWGFGADFDNMKIRCWYEHHFPLLMTEGLIPDLRKAYAMAHYWRIVRRYRHHFCRVATVALNLVYPARYPPLFGRVTR